MSDNVVNLGDHLEHVGSGYRFDPKQVLEKAKEFEFENLVVMGEDAEGELYLASNGNSGIAMILMEKAKRLIVFGES